MPVGHEAAGAVVAFLADMAGVVAVEGVGLPAGIHAEHLGPALKAVQQQGVDGGPAVATGAVEALQGKGQAVRGRHGAVQAQAHLGRRIQGFGLGQGLALGVGGGVALVGNDAEGDGKTQSDGDDRRGYQLGPQTHGLPAHLTPGNKVELY